MGRVLSGMRPTGPLHLGHLLGALENWKALQAQHECFFMVADLHALMGEYENPANLRKYTEQMIMDWLACGIKPENIFIQSQIPEHAELALILGMMTPLGWLERNPTYKEQLREIEGRDLTTYGFLGYPVLQAADILLYKADRVPVGEDQKAHLELTREIVRRFNGLYKKELFPEPKELLTAQARILGTDRRKMSKSYDNAISLGDDEISIRKKVQTMITDPSRIKVADPGHPDECNVFSYYKIFSKDAGLVEEVRGWCSGAKKGCTDCKKQFADVLVGYMKPLREEREGVARRYPSEKCAVSDVIRSGQERAQAQAKKTLAEVKELLHLGAGTK